MRTSGTIVAAALTAALMAGGCSGAGGTATPSPTALPSGTAGPSPTASPSASASTAPSPTATAVPTPAFLCPFATTTLEVPSNTLVGLVVTHREGYDELAFVFGPMGQGSGAVPTVEVAPATPPFTRSPSDLPLSVTGDSFLRVILRETIVADESGTPVFVGSTDIRPTGGVVRQVVEAEASEGVVQWLVGVAGQACARLGVDPAGARLLLDVRAP